MKKLFLLITLLSVFTDFANAQVIYYTYAFKESGSMEYETIVEPYYGDHTFELNGQYLIQRDIDDDTPTYYKYNKAISAVMEYPSFLGKTSEGEYILMTIGEGNEIIEIQDFDPDEPEEGVEDKWVYVHRLSSRNKNVTITPPSYYNGGNLNGGNSSSNSSVYTTCNSCNGTGVCPSCNGKKGSWKDTGYRVGQDIRSWIDCGNCRGRGTCPICYGRGKL